MWQQAQKGAEKEIGRIQDLLALASEEAVLQGREFGLTFYAKEYQFSSYDPADRRWKPLGDDADPFTPRQFPPETIVDLEIEGRIVRLAAEMPVVKVVEKQADEKASDRNHRICPCLRRTRIVPQVFMLSSGDITPFTLRLRPSIGSPGISLHVAENGTVTQIRDER